MLTVHQLAKSFALNSLFTNVTFNINPGDRVGLIGPNGCGKTTLLRIIAGGETADTGRAARIMAGLELDQVPPDLVVGRLSGGQKTRLNLALVLLGDPQLLL